jgi:hypothetical protein
MHSQLVVAVAQGALTNIIVSAFGWLSRRAVPLWHSMQRWWGGEAGRVTVWNLYTDGRQTIMAQERNNDMRLILIQDLRQQCRLTYPAYASMWN